VLSVPLSQVRLSILRRQGLIEPFEGPLDAVRAMVAVQTQYAASLPTSVASRVKKPRPGWDEVALEPGGSLIKSWSLRHTLHAHTCDDHALVVGTLGQHLYANYLHFMQNRKSVDNVGELEDKVLVALQDRPLTRRELHDRVPELKAIDGVGWGLDVMGLAFQRRICVVGRGSQQKFCNLAEQQAVPSYGELLRRYLASYGPATKADFAYWTGFKGPQVQSAFSELSSEVVSIQVEGLSGVRFGLPETLHEFESGLIGVRLLAKFDPLVLAHKEKSIFIPTEHKTKVFRIAGQVEAVVLVEGIAAGTWRMDRKRDRVLYTIEPFRRFGTREESRLSKEAERMTKALGSKEFDIRFVSGEA